MKEMSKCVSRWHLTRILRLPTQNLIMYFHLIKSIIFINMQSCPSNSCDLVTLAPGCSIMYHVRRGSFSQH